VYSRSSLTSSSKLLRRLYASAIAIRYSMHESDAVFWAIIIGRSLKLFRLFTIILLSCGKQGRPFVMRFAVLHHSENSF